MKKIIHLTDIHIGYKDMGKRFVSLLTKLAYTKEPANNYVVVITGDIIDNGFDEKNFIEAQSYIQMLKNLGFEVLVIPGNHDYGNGVYADEKFVNIFKQTYFGNVNIKYPKVDIISEIAFIGLDSMAKGFNILDERLLAQGELGSEQLNDLKQIFSDSNHLIQAKKRVVYLHHHPFDYNFSEQLIDSRELGEILQANRIDALLFGHRHEGKKWNGKWGIPRVYDGGTSTAKDDGRNPHRVIDLERDPGQDYDAEFLD